MANAKTVKKTTTKKTAAAGGLKKPMTAFFHYLGDRRSKIVEEKPELKKAAKEIAKLVGEEWRAMSEAEKKPFTDKANAEKAEYERKKAAAPSAATEAAVKATE